MEITIKDKVYNLKYTIRALFIFEQISGKMFKINTLTDEYLFFYCLIMANNPGTQLTFEDLIDEIDENPSLMRKYKEFMDDEAKKQAQFNKEEEKEEKGKKKKR